MLITPSQHVIKELITQFNLLLDIILKSDNIGEMAKHLG